MVFKLIASFGLMFGAMPDADGWVALDRSVQRTEASAQSEEDDPSIWVIFSKTLGGERFMVRFPEDPAYVYMDDGGMEISFKQAGSSYLLRVLPASSNEEIIRKIKETVVRRGVSSVEAVRSSDFVFDLSYREDGKSVAQRFFISQKYVYVLETKSAVFHRENHQKFVDSLDVIFT